MKSIWPLPLSIFAQGKSNSGNSCNILWGRGAGDYDGNNYFQWRQAIIILKKSLRYFLNRYLLLISVAYSYSIWWLIPSRNIYCIHKIYIYNPPNNWCGLSLNKPDHVICEIWMMVIRWYPLSNLTSVIQWEQNMIQAKILTGLGKPKKTFCKSQWQINKKLVDNSITRKKSTKYARTIYVHFTSEIIQRVDTLLIYWRIMPSAERLSSRFHSCPCFAS